METICINCGKKIKRFPCRLRKYNYCGTHCRLVYGYANGLIDKKEITKKANAHVRKYGQPKLKGLMVGEKNPAWKGGRIPHSSGYMRVRHNNTYVLEHRLVWEQNNGEIPKGCQIHHMNHNKQDNRIENLMMMTNSKHQKLDPQPRDKENNRFIRR